MPFWRTEIETWPDLYDYEDSSFERPKIIGYFSVGENSEPIEDLSTLRYLSCEPKTIDLDISRDESDDTEVVKPEPLFKYIASHAEIIQRCIGTGIEDVGFVFARSTLNKIGRSLNNRWSTFKLCAHLLRGVIYVYHELESYENYPLIPDKFNQHYYRTVDSDPNVKKEKFMIVLETKLFQHNIVYRSELVGLETSEEEIPPNLERNLVIDEINKRNIVELTVTTNSMLSENKAMKMWTKCFWGNVDKTLCGFANENFIIKKVESYNTRDLETVGKGEWKEQEILNFTGELLTLIKDCFKNKFKSLDVQSANERLYFQKNLYETIRLVKSVHFNNSHWIPAWYINNQPIP